jgi:hypothetical protein
MQRATHRPLSGPLTGPLSHCHNDRPDQWGDRELTEHDTIGVSDNEESVQPPSIPQIPVMNL